MRLFSRSNASEPKQERDVSTLLHALTDPRPETRREAASALWQLHDSAAVDGLIAAVDDADLGVQVTATMALGALCDARAVEPLVAVLRDPTRRGVFITESMAADMELGNPGDPLFEHLLGQGTSWPVELGIRPFAAAALREIGGPEAQGALGEYEAEREKKRARGGV